jgi:GDSL-like lipase/acylhydrolase family protein
MTDMRWTTFPGGPLECSGLPWLDENLPHLWRLPQQSAASLPERVQRQLPYPAGARLRLRSDTSGLRLRVRCISEQAAPGLDIHVDGRFWGTAVSADGDVACFAGASREPKEISVYLPLRHELQVVAYAVDADAECEKPEAFARAHPFVLYGSSVAQGIGASRPGMSYASILSRSMSVDHVNLGFGGAGKAEPEVVALLTQIDACCYLLDLGKSYGRQSAAAYATMLASLRCDHPTTPIVCITPIFSSREFSSEEYVDLSRYTRVVAREAVAQRLAQGDGLTFLVEGESLLSPEDTDGLARDGVHPNELGHSLIAERLRPAIEAALRAADGCVEPLAAGDAERPRA